MVDFCCGHYTWLHYNLAVFLRCGIYALAKLEIAQVARWLHVSNRDRGHALKKARGDAVMKW